MEHDNLNYCPNCHVHVDGALARCPLCQAPLTASPSENTMYAPHASERRKRNRNFYEDLLLFLSFAAVVGACVINLLTWYGNPWCIGVAATVICVWIFLKTWDDAKYPFGARLLLQGLGVVAVLLAIDYQTGMRGWCVNYIVPFFLIGCNAAIDLYAYVYKSRWVANLIFAFLFVILGYLPLIFCWSGIASAWTPAILSAVASTLTLLGILRFAIRSFALEMKKRFHV